MMIRAPFLTALSLVCILYPTPHLHARYQFRTIALSGTTAPGSGGSGADVPFTGFTRLIINDSGEVAFFGVTSPNADGGDFGIFSTAGGTLNGVAFRGQIAPGSGGSGADVPFTDFERDELYFNAAGEVAFIALTSTNADGGEQGIFSTLGGTLNAVAFEGQIAPGSGGSGADVPFGTFSRIVFNDLTLNAAGEVAFMGSTSFNADGDDNGIFSTVGGTLNAVAFEGQVAPGSGGSGADVTFANLNNIRKLRINAAGEVVFRAETSPNTDGGNLGIFSTVGGTLDAVAFEGQIAPGSGGSGADVQFAGFPIFRPDINASGEVAFLASISANADGGTSGIFSTAGGTLDAVAIAGQVAPGSGGADVPIVFIHHTPLINDSGEVVFRAFTALSADGIDQGIFSDTGGALKAVAFEGQVAPGSGGSGAEVPFSGFLRDYNINASGVVSFIATTSANADGGDRGIFSTLGGTLNAVVFEGDQIEVSPGDFRTVASVPFSESGGLNDSGVSSLNDRGELTFKATFTDGSEGIFVVTIPEPSSLILLSTWGVLLVCRRRNLPSKAMRARFIRRSANIALLLPKVMVMTRKFTLLVAIMFSVLPAMPGVHAQLFTTIFDVPPDVAPASIGSDTQLNLSAGGTLPASFMAGSLDGTSTNVEVNIDGGTVEAGFLANPGSHVFVSGGDLVDADSFGGDIQISGGVFTGRVSALNGSLLEVLDGDLSAASAWSFGSFDAVGQSTVIVRGGTVGAIFANPVEVGSTAAVEIRGGVVGDGSPGIDVEVFKGSDVTISGGMVMGDVRSEGDSSFKLQGGEILGRLFISSAFSPSGDIPDIVNISGGSVGSLFADKAAEVNLFGTQFVLGTNDFTGTLTEDVPMTILDRTETLSGVLADGSAFSFDLSGAGADSISASSLLTVTLVNANTDSADFDTDNDIDGADFLAWQRGFGTDAGTGNVAPQADGNANGDQFIDAADLAVWENQYGTVTPPLSATTSVPEPATLALLSMSLAFLATRRRKWDSVTSVG